MTCRPKAKSKTRIQFSKNTDEPNDEITTPMMVTESTTNAMINENTTAGDQQPEMTTPIIMTQLTTNGTDDNAQKGSGNSNTTIHDKENNQKPEIDEDDAEDDEENDDGN